MVKSNTTTASDKRYAAAVNWAGLASFFGCNIKEVKGIKLNNDNTLYMTDDLEGRLDEDSLKEPIVKVVKVDQNRSPLDIMKDPPKFRPPPVFDSEFPDSSDDEAVVEPEQSKLTAMISFVANGDCKTVTGTLQAFSFGKGWLCSIEGVDEDEALNVAAHFAAYRDALDIDVYLKDKRVRLTGELDFTIGFGFGGITFTVAANEGRYIPL